MFAIMGYKRYCRTTPSGMLKKLYSSSPGDCVVAKSDGNSEEERLGLSKEETQRRKEEQ